MNFIISIIISIVALIILAISGGYATSAAASVTFIDGYDNNEKLKSAHTKLTWAAVITWIVVTLILILSIVFFIFIYDFICSIYSFCGNIISHSS